MNQLNQIVKQYLEMDTNNAMMITGEWGTGKTYYFNHELKRIIENSKFNEKSETEEEKKYKAILVSLFGLKSIDEIRNQIFLSLYPIFNSKGAKITKGITSVLLKGIQTFTKFEKISELFTGVDDIKERLIKLDGLVLCFDDLERVSKDFNIEEFIGFINSMVENDNMKIIVIANETKIIDENYKKFKEKVIGNTIEFIPDFEKPYDSIIKKKFSNDKNYLKFLRENKKYILQIFTQNSNNLRTLIFALNYYEYIYKKIESKLLKDTKLKEKKTEIILNTLRFSIVISIEFKDGNLDFNNKNELDNYDPIWFGMIEQKSNRILPNISETKRKDNEEKDDGNKYAKDFYIKYYHGKQYIYYESIFNFLTGGAILDQEQLLSELKEIYHIQNEEVLPQYELYNKLSYQACFQLNNDKYIKLTKELLQFANDGAFDLKYYLSIYHYISRFDNPLNYKLKTIEKRIISGIEKGKDIFRYIDNLQFHLNPESKQLDNHQKAIFDMAIEINKYVKEKIEIKKYKVMEELCHKDFIDFESRFQPINSEYLYKPILSMFNPNKFYNLFKEAKNGNKWNIVWFFYEREKYYNQKTLIPEKEFLQKLKEKAENNKYFKSGKNITGFIYKELVKILSQSINHIESHQK